MERCSIHEGCDKRLLVRFQLRLPAISADDETQPYRARVRHERGELRTNPVARPVESINQSACLLELDRQEVSSRNILSVAAAALEKRATLDYLIAPEVEARFVRFTTKEIEVVLAHEVLRRVQRIDEPAARQRGAEGCFRRLTQLAEAARCGTEAVVCARRRDRVEAAGLYVIETVEAVRVSDELVVLGAAESDHRAFYGRAFVVDDAA